MPLAFDWRSFNSRRWLACLVYGLIAGAFLFIIGGFCMGSVFLYEYYSIARSLPTVSDLQQRASQFETTRILDRNGNLLYEILDPNAGRRTYVTLDKVSPALVAATIATEDKDFYIHPGYDFWAILRALWQNYITGDTVSGASTITQQLARALLLSPEERSQRTYLRKAREIILAAEITRRYSKDQILELYLNEIYYGNLAYGIEAAAETYFGTTADKLTLSQAAFLAGLPQSPAVYDIYTNSAATLLRQQQVLVLMFALSNQRGCIEVSNSPGRVCVDATSASGAANEMKSYTFKAPDIDIRYPHWVNYVRSQLEAQYDPQRIYRSGFTIYTTLDPTLQDMAQQMVTDQVAQLVDKNAHDGALVAIRPSTGEILAMVGSPDFYNVEISGQINMAVSATRQPGSSIKPITYVAAFEKGWTPATLIWDVPSEFPPSGDPNDTRDPYKPVNYDGKFHGPVTVRTALSNSFNLPAGQLRREMARRGHRPRGALELVQHARRQDAQLRRHLRRPRHDRHGQAAGHHLVHARGLRPLAHPGWRRRQPARHDLGLLGLRKRWREGAAGLDPEDHRPRGQSRLRIQTPAGRTGHPPRTRLPDQLDPLGQRCPLVDVRPQLGAQPAVPGGRQDRHHQRFPR